MIKNECKHEWEKQTNVQVGGQEGTYLCKKCKSELHAGNVFQLETLLHLQGFQKYIAIVALVISFLALLISLFK